MKYRNISEQNLSVPTATQTDGITVRPGGDILTAPKFAKQFLDAGQLEVVKVKQPRSQPQKQTKETNE